MNRREALTGKQQIEGVVERAGWTECPRERHISVTDSERYVYLIGSSHKTAKRAVERYDCDTNSVERMADLP